MAHITSVLFVLLGASLCLIGGAPNPSEGYLLNRWTARDLALLGASVYGSKCYVIPDNLTLCYGIGYDRMRLPNLLNHDTLAEAIDQSQIWLALTRTNCHHDLRVFLCSMYAPVCLQEPTKLKPCRSLCQNVRESCLPRMQAVGYEWPDILRCDRFPSDNQLCVPPRINPKCESEQKSRETRAPKAQFIEENATDSMLSVVWPGSLR